MKKVLSVSGMTCVSCEERVSRSLEDIEGVVNAKAFRESSKVEIELEQEVPLETLKSAASVGGKYRVSERTEAKEHSASESDESEESLYPLFLIVGYILGTCVIIAISQGVFSLPSFMRHFMAGFFLVFSFFKLLDLSGFVEAYRGYDLLARASKPWAYAYPFVELALGVLYALNYMPLLVNVVTFILMTVGALGVLKALLDKQAIRCACLGTALNLPMTKVTLVEDVSMAVMAFVMLLISF